MKHDALVLSTYLWIPLNWSHSSFFRFASASFVSVHVLLGRGRGWGGSVGFSSGGCHKCGGEIGPDLQTPRVLEEAHGSKWSNKRGRWCAYLSRVRRTMTSASSEHAALVRVVSCLASAGVTTSNPADVPGSSSGCGPPESSSQPSEPVRNRLDPDWCSEYRGVETPDSGESPEDRASAFVSGMDNFKSCVSIAVSSSALGELIEDVVSCPLSCR